MKRLFLICLSISMLSADNAYLLPHRWQDVRHLLTGMLHGAKTPVVIVTDAINDPYLRRTLRKALENNTPVTLITGSETTASQWAFYKTLNACLLPFNAALTYSLVSVEDRSACMLSMPMRTDAMRTLPGLLLCSDSAAFSESIRLLRQECKSYFKERDGD